MICWGTSLPSSRTPSFANKVVFLVSAKKKKKIARRNINNLRYADDIILMAEGGEELKSLLMKVKE